MVNKIKNLRILSKKTTMLMKKKIHKKKRKNNNPNTTIVFHHLVWMKNSKNLGVKKTPKNNNNKTQTMIMWIQMMISRMQTAKKIFLLVIMTKTVIQIFILIKNNQNYQKNCMENNKKLIKMKNYQANYLMTTNTTLRKCSIQLNLIWSLEERN